MAVTGLAAANLGIALAHRLARRIVDRCRAPAGLEGIPNLRIVDDRLWRGGAPPENLMEEMARRGVSTVIDLRAEKGLADMSGRWRALGLEHVAIPVRDGQAPRASDVEAFLTAVEQAPGIVFVHCGAGVGRTGTMVAAYLAGSGSHPPLARVWHNLSVGPPSLEQLAFALGGTAPGAAVAPVVVGLSRLLDAPRRARSRARQSWGASSR